MAIAWLSGSSGPTSSNSSTSWPTASYTIRTTTIEVQPTVTVIATGSPPAGATRSSTRPQSSSNRPVCSSASGVKGQPTPTSNLPFSATYTPDTSSFSSHLSQDQLAGISIASALALLIIVCTVLYLLRRPKRKRALLAAAHPTPGTTPHGSTFAHDPGRLRRTAGESLSPAMASNNKYLLNDSQPSRIHDNRIVSRPPHSQHNIDIHPSPNPKLQNQETINPSTHRNTKSNRNNNNRTQPHLPQINTATTETLQINAATNHANNTTDHHLETYNSQSLDSILESDYSEDTTVPPHLSKPVNPQPTGKDRQRIVVVKHLKDHSNVEKLHGESEGGNLGEEEEEVGIREVLKLEVELELSGDAREFVELSRECEVEWREGRRGVSGKGKRGLLR